MWSKKLQHNINLVPARYSYWVRKDFFAYTEEHRQVIDLCHKLWLKEIAPFVSKQAQETFVHTNLLSSSGVWSDDFVQAFADAGWKVIPVNGIISQKVFFELLNDGFLPFAVNVRTIEYLNDPFLVDFIHDFFQFYRVIFDKEFSEFLRALGRVGSAVIFNANDVKVNRVLKSLNRMKYRYPFDSDHVQIEQMRIRQTLAQFADEPLSEAGKIVNFYYKTLKQGALGTQTTFDLVGTFWNLSFFGIEEKLQHASRQVLTLEEVQHSADFLSEKALYFFPSFAYLTVLLEKIEQTLIVKKDSEAIIKSAITSDFPVKLTLDKTIQVISNFIDIEKYPVDEQSEIWFVKGVGLSKVLLDDNEIFRSEDGYDLMYYFFKQTSPIEYIGTATPGEQLHLSFSETIKLDATVENTYPVNQQDKIIELKDCYIYLDEKIIFHKKYVIPLFSDITGIKPTFVDDKSSGKSKKLPQLFTIEITKGFEWYNKIKQGLSDSIPAQYSWLFELVQKTAY